MTAARNRILDRLRAEAVAARVFPVLAVEAELVEEAQRTMALGADAVGAVADERLRLVLLCAHPSLSRDAAAALTMRLVLGVSTEDLARLFLVRTTTMAARLTRARKRLAGESFGVPVGAELAERVRIVSDVAYLAFTAGYAPGSGMDVLRADVAGEAIRLVRVLRELLPGCDSEVDALLALMLLQHSRRDARVESGRLVLLPDQDRRRWHAREIGEAIELLTPLAHAEPAPYLLQALIAAEHAIAPTPEETDWSRIVARYDELLALTGSPVVQLNRAVAVGEADGALAGLAALDGLTERELPGHRLPAARAELLSRAGRGDAARAAYTAAIGRCGNEAERAHLEERRAAV
jgi:predicted RNA polymerase sigma factor